MALTSAEPSCAFNTILRPACLLIGNANFMVLTSKLLYTSRSSVGERRAKKQNEKGKGTLPFGSREKSIIVIVGIFKVKFSNFSRL